MAFCGELEVYDGRRDLLLNPSLIGEVRIDSIDSIDSTLALAEIYDKIAFETDAESR